VTQIEDVELHIQSKSQLWKRFSFDF